MFDRKTIGNMRRSGLKNLLIGFLVLVAGLSFVISSSSTAVAEERTSVLKGEVIAIDNYSRTFTVKPVQMTKPSMTGKAGEVTFASDRKTNVVWCNMNRSFNDIKIGDRVSVSYHERGGRLYANVVDIQTLVVACYEQ